MSGPRIGLLSPIVVRVPGTDAPWEATAGPGDLTAIARYADALGYHHLTCSEHVGVPVEVATVRGGTYWDPLSTLSYLAAHTTRIRLATNVLVLGYHHPLALAKSYGTLDRLSGGRVVLGLGVGSLREEFGLLGAPFDGRGERADDALRALRAAWGRSVPSYRGSHYAFTDFVLDPTATSPRVPLWIGGRTARSLRRAVELGDGWMPFGLAPSLVTELLGRVEAPAGFEVVLRAGPLDPIDAPQSTVDSIESVALAGATVLNARFVHRDRDHLVEQLHALTELYPAAGWTPANSHAEEEPA